MASGPNFPVFNFDPNWSGVLTETLSWKTDVLSSKTGDEQRRSLLRVPRKKIEYVGLYAELDRARLDNALTGYGAHDWLLPAWWDQHRLAEDVSVNATFIPCDTTLTGLFFAGRKALIRIDRTTFEIVEIKEVVADGLVLKNGLVNKYSAANTRLYPLQQARFDVQPQIMRASDGVVTASMRFKITEPDPLASIAFRLTTSTALITNGLIARRMPAENDGIFNANSGISIGQAAMSRAMFEAANALRQSAVAETVSEADRWQQVGQSLLDGIVGAGSRTGAILRRAAPLGPGEFVLPHWLYAARGPVGDLADIGEGYELIPDEHRLRDFYASSDGAALRDFHVALAYARDNDTRGGDARMMWRLLDSGMMVTQLQNRKIPDGRAVFDLWPGLPAVLPAGAEPTGLACFSTHADGTSPNVLGVNAGNIGYNFLSRDSVGRVVFDVPNSYDYSQVAVPVPTNTPPENNGQPPETQDEVTYVLVPTVFTYSRSFSDHWRSAQSWQSADSYMMIDYTISRALESDEKIQVGVKFGNQIWTATLNGSETVVGNKHFVPRSSFVDGSGQQIQPGQEISQSFVSVTAKLAYRFVLSRMRLVPTLDREEDASPFFPGVDGFRTSGYNNLGLVVGYRGSPWIGGQTVDLWPLMAIDQPSFFTALSPSDLPSFDFQSRQIIYPFTASTGQGVVKPPYALLGEQAVAFLKAAQDKYQQDAANVSGPMAHTFVLNRPDSSEFGNVIPLSWLYKNLRSSEDVFWQLRAIEGLANFTRLVKTNKQGLVYNGQQITYNGKKVVVNNYKQDEAIIPFNEYAGWSDSYQNALNVAYKFLLWIVGSWKGPLYVTYNGQPVTYNGQPIYKFYESYLETFSTIPSYVDDPRLAPVPYSTYNVYSIALILRSALFLRQTDHPNYMFYEATMVMCWNYLERYYQRSGQMKGTWSPSINQMDWRYGEIITALAEMLKTPSFLPAEIPIADVEARLIDAIGWIETTGSQTGEPIPGMDKFYLSIPVLIRAPDEKGNMSVDVDRLTEDFDNEISIPLQSEYDPEPFNRPQHTWWIRGREQHDEFRKMLYALRGRAVAFWKPTFMRDLIPVEDLLTGSFTLRVANVGYTSNGGPRRSREHVIVFLRDGTQIFRQIVSSEEIDDRIEEVRFNTSFRRTLTPADVLRISFLDLVRMDQDGFQFAHITDTDGVSSSTTVMRSVKAA